MSIINFKYSIEKDLNNYKNSWFEFKYPKYGRKTENLSVNQFIFPSVIRAIEEANNEKDKIDLATRFLEKYYNKHKMVFQVLIDSLGSTWDEIENIYVEKLEKYFGKKNSIKHITCFFTTLTIAPYDLKSRTFMVSYFAGLPHQINTVMHEFMHLYFLSNYKDYLEERGLSNQSVLEINEAITVLLNYEFGDLIPVPAGNNKPTTLDLQEKIVIMWKEEKDFVEILEELIRMRTGPPKNK